MSTENWLMPFLDFHTALLQAVNEGSSLSLEELLNRLNDRNLNLFAEECVRIVNHYHQPFEDFDDPELAEAIRLELNYYIIVKGYDVKWLKKSDLDAFLKAVIETEARLLVYNYQNFY